MLDDNFLTAIDNPNYRNILYIFNEDLINTIIGHVNTITYEDIISLEMIRETKRILFSEYELEIFEANILIKELFEYSIDIDSDRKIYEKIWLILYLVIHTTEYECDLFESGIWAKSIVSEIERVTSRNISELGLVAEQIHFTENRTLNRKNYSTNWQILDEMKEKNFDIELMYEVALLNSAIDILKMELDLPRVKKEGFLEKIKRF